MYIIGCSSLCLLDSPDLHSSSSPVRFQSTNLSSKTQTLKAWSSIQQLGGGGLCGSDWIVKALTSSVGESLLNLQFDGIIGK